MATNQCTMGFLLSWNSRLLANSLAKDIYWLPLIIDVFFYAILGYVIWRFIAKYIFSRPPIVKIPVLILLCLYGIVAFWLMVIAASIDPLHHLWFQYDSKIINLALGFNI